ncbi:copper amine oxidase N-terminal domain-containing protein [Paenibacillus spongiae]|uniref:Copper amine oxidase N-terminal domain-containing protein n=1 Tax=Paenibacillus spongiae TaxID=2909671 RepID=A0ABY5SCR1_9BACL|nr:copper amine oxidase N-terminal domain-containing protein [Paenibacillus spongiae]UVI31727.1 copper amine oxidase N-terminal domain-containing protein [Paenibacillus spongiae]
MVKWMKRKSVLAVMLAAVMMIAAGCQAVGGVDLNQMLKQTLKVGAYEGSQTLEFKLLMDEGELGASEEDKALFDLISHIKLTLDDIKVKDAENASFKGKLELGKKQIGFKLAMNAEAAVLELDGAKKPIVLEVANLMASNELFGQVVDQELSIDGKPDQPELTQDQEESLAKAGQQLIETVAGYAIDKLPNPARIKVSPAQETVRGENVNVMHVQAELSGKEIYPWIKSYMDALVSDKENLRKTIAAVYDLVQSQEDVLGSAGVDTESIFGSIPEEDDRSKAIDEAVNEIVQGIADLKQEMEQAEKEEADFVNAIFNEETFVKADLFVDSKLDVRKSVIEVSVKPSAVEGDEEMSFSPITGIWIKATSEKSNVNGDIKPDEAVIPKDGLTVEQFFDMQGYQVLRQFDNNSVMYDILRNQMHISRQQIHMYPEYSSNPPIITPAGITLIPLRDTSDRLGATIKATDKGKSITLRDDATSTTIELKSGSKQAAINGKTVNWSFPVTVVDGVTYVPARDFVKALGGKVYWEDSYDDEKMLVIEREL